MACAGPPAPSRRLETMTPGWWDGREPTGPVVCGQHSREALPVRVDRVPKPALFQDQGVDTRFPQPQCRDAAAVAASHHDRPVMGPGWGGRVSLPAEFERTRAGRT